MSEVTWKALQRIFDDEPPLTVWREERGLSLDELAERSGIAIERLLQLEADMSLATDVEVDRLAAALRIPFEFLAVPHLTAAA
jgi:transcriptional regulator with XRE-family HTH domain